MAAEIPTPPPLPPSSPSSAAPQQYWCYHCDKRVSVESLPGQPDDNLICTDCKFGFVESIPSPSPPSSALATSPDFFNINNHQNSNHFDLETVTVGGVGIDEPTLGSQFLHVLRLLAQVARDDHPAPPPPPPPPPPARGDDPDFLRIEIDGWDHPLNHRSHGDDNQHVHVGHERDGENGEEEEDEIEDDDDEEEEERSVEIEGETDEEEEEEEREDEMRRRRRDVLRMRLRDFASRARSGGPGPGGVGGGRNRILDWAEILMGLEDNSIEFRFEMPATEDRYIGDPGDYVDAAEYEALLQNLAEAEGRRGAPPAAKSAVEGLKVVEVKEGEEREIYACAICKDGVSVGDVVKEMPCGHGYHGDCIVPWLSARNSCPVCRFELPTDDVEYEEARKKRSPGSTSGVGNNSNDNSAAASSL